VKVKFNSFFISVQEGGGRSASRPNISAGNSLRYSLQVVSGYVGLNGVEEKNSCPCQESNARRPIRSRALY